MSCDHPLPQMPGVVTRRTALHGVWAMPAFALLSRWARAHSSRTNADELTDFLALWARRAQELVEAEEPNEDALVFELCGALARLDAGSFPARRRVAYQGRGLTTGPVWGEGAFSLLEIEIEPNVVLPAHNHVGYDFVTLALRGEAHARHFEPWGEAADPKRDIGRDFEVREVSSAHLVPGRTTTLTRTRANIHGFQAGPEGATLLDFGVHFPDPGDGPKDFSVLEYEPRAKDPERRIHTARWVGNIYTRDSDSEQK